MRRPLPTTRLPDHWLSERGLTSAEVDERRRTWGRNDIVEVPGHSFRDLARDTAKDPMIWFLAAASALYALVGQRTEALTLLVAIVPLIAMDAFLHRRTQASTEGLHGRLAATATVVRDGTAREVPAAEVVPGELALVAQGDPFPADGVLVAGAALQADESTLTGEAYPVHKRPLAAPPEDGTQPALESEYWGFAGTRLLTGRAALRVVLTGGETVYGEIVRSAGRGSHARTPLQTAIQDLVSMLIAAAAVMCLIMAVARLRQGYGWLDALVSAVTLASAALPEEFPVVFTFFLGVGVYRLAKRQALVRRAVSVENIGRVTCICSDKTGTITEGRLRLTHLLPAPDETDGHLLRLAAIASRPEAGDPLDAAIVRAAEAAAALGDEYVLLGTFPFTEGRRRETAIVRGPAGALLAATKGAAEVVLGMAALAPAEREAWQRRVVELASGGHKVIACAWRPLDRGTSIAEEADHEYRLAGLLAFEDPVREGVAQAVRTCRDAGIHTIMVTGDHPLTAGAVAREIGLGGGAPVVISGDELEERAARGAPLSRVDVIARAAPSQKLTLVRALQEAGEIVVVTGDGVNDVPALQAADVGIAMGERGTRSAREVAAMVLLDDNFRTIVGAIREGRQLLRNLRSAFQYLLIVHIPLVITAALVPLAGYPLLYLPVHIVWLEMIIHPTALLVFQELPAAGPLGRRREPTRARFFSRGEWAVIGAVGGLLTLLVVAGYVRSVEERGNVEHGRAMALVTLTVGSAAVTAVLSRLRGWSARLVVGGSLGLAILLVQTPALAALLHLEPLHLDDWAAAVAGSLVAAALPPGLAAVFRRRSS
ncbi:MAG: cation-transporting P-type ATPase [Candidatus Rokubacteria bacterium]|nr:cation-transporting P-type ATPase [Candidatus Rokubacteria bacterium]